MVVKSNLKYILDSQGISIRELERLTGISFETLRRIATNTATRYSADTLDKLCEVLDCEISDILVREKGSDN